MSRYLEYNQSEFRNYLLQKRMEIKDDHKGQWCIKVCPFCSPTNGKPDNEWKLYVRQDSGAFRCNRCNASGSCFDLKRDLGDIPADNRQSKQKNYVLPNPAKYLQATQQLATYDPVRDWLASRGINKETAERYSVGAMAARFCERDEQGERWVDENCVMFPFFDFDANSQLRLIRSKIRSVTQKKNMRFEPSGGAEGFFGWQHVQKDQQELIITEGEMDAMIAWQQTGIVAVSVPHGNKMSPELIKKLESIPRLYLWMDDDKPGRECVEKLWPILGIERCFIVQTREGADAGPKDANDAYLQGLDLRKIIASAKVKPHAEIMRPGQFKDAAVDQLMNPAKYLGVPVPGFPQLNEILGGIRDSELTVITGPTGFGKTTFIRQIALTLLREKFMPMMFFSFEIRNEKLMADCAAQMLPKFADRTKESLEDAIDELNSLPFYLGRFWGSTDVNEVIKAATYAVKVNGVRIIVIDNLQFMLSTQAKGANKFDLQDEAIHKLRIFVNQFKVHLFLISHPKKWGHGTALDMSAIFGTAKLTQDSDNVILLQPGSDGEQYIEIQKNRWLGRKGKIFYEFDEPSLSIRETSPPVVIDNRKFAKQANSGKDLPAIKAKSDA